MKKTLITLALFSLANSAFAIQANTDLVLKKESQNGNNIIVSVEIDNPSNQNISSVQSWLEFDQDKINCKSINTDESKFDFVVPGESNISGNLIKIGRSSLSGDVADSKVNVAKINCEVLKDGGEIRFHDYQTDGGKVSVMVFENGFPVNTLKGEPKSLKFETEKKVEIKEANSEINLQVQSNYIERPNGLKLDTGVGYVTLVWNEVQGAEKYYVYYGKISGRYLQRRLVPNNEIYKLEGLETGSQYFFAITAVGNGDLESDYSNEQAIIVGKPQTSTSTISKIAEPKKVLESVQNVQNTNINNVQNSINTKIENKNISQNVQTGPMEITLISFVLAILMGAFIYRRKFI